jgi:hypothetical protein
MSTQKLIKRAMGVYWWSIFLTGVVEILKRTPLPYLPHIVLIVVLSLIFTYLTYLIYLGFVAIAHEYNVPVLKNIFLPGFVLGILFQLWIVAQVIFAPSLEHFTKVIPLIFALVNALYLCTLAFYIQKLPDHFRSLPKTLARINVYSAITLVLVQIVPLLFVMQGALLFIHFIISILLISFSLLECLYGYLLFRIALHQDVASNNTFDRFWNYLEIRTKTSFAILTIIIFIVLMGVGVYLLISDPGELIRLHAARNA